MVRKEIRDLLLILLGEQRAGDVDKPTTGLHQTLATVENLRLERDELGEVLWPEPPLCIGIAPPGASAGARRVDENAIEALGVALHPFVTRARKRHALHDAGAGAAKALGGALEPPCGDITSDEVAAVLHRCGERQRLAAGA